MSTSQTARVPLRMRFTPDSQEPLDGAWWPQTRDLALELADLVDHFPASTGRIDRAVYSPPDWLPAPRRIPIARGFLKVGSFPRDDTHSLVISLATGQRLTLHVVPADEAADDGQWDDDGQPWRC